MDDKNKGELEKSDDLENNTLNDPERSHATTKSVFEVAREEHKKLKLEKLKYESHLTAKMADYNDKKRHSYEQQLQNEKIELIRLKQGEIENSNIIETNETPAKPLTFKGKMSNFFYHYKWLLIVSVCVISFASVMIYDLVSKENPDIIVMMLENNDPLGAEYSVQIADYFSTLTDDFNNDKKTVSDFYYMPYTGEDVADYYSGSSTKLTVYMQTAECMLAICGENSNEIIDPEYTFVNLEEMYPDNPYIDGYRFYLKDTSFAEKIGYTGEIDDETYIAIRKVRSLAFAKEQEMQDAYDDAIIILDRFINDIS